MTDRHSARSRVTRISEAVSLANKVLGALGLEVWVREAVIYKEEVRTTTKNLAR